MMLVDEMDAVRSLGVLDSIEAVSIGFAGDGAAAQAIERRVFIDVPTFALVQSDG